MNKKITETINEIYRDRKPKIIGSKSGYAVFVPIVEKNGRPHLLFELRSRTLDRQPGEVCFPGGQMEEGENEIQCAVRETVEELGVLETDIKVIAQLDTVYNYNNITMYCFIGTIDEAALKKASFNGDEVEELFMVPLKFFMDNEPEMHYVKIVPQVKNDFPYERMNFKDGYNWKTGRMEVPFYWYGDKVIWGITGRITHNLMRQLAEHEV